MGTPMSLEDCEVNVAVAAVGRRLACFLISELFATGLPIYNFPILARCIADLAC